MVKLKRKPQIVAGVKWNGYNIMEVDTFLGYGRGQKFPNTEEEFNEFIKMQDNARKNGLDLITLGPDAKVFVGNWVVQYDDGTYDICPEYVILQDYTIVEE